MFFKYLSLQVIDEKTSKEFAQRKGVLLTPHHESSSHNPLQNRLIN